MAGSPPYDPATPALPYTPSDTVQSTSQALRAATDHLAYLHKQTNDKAEIARGEATYRDATKRNSAALAARRKAKAGK